MDDSTRGVTHIRECGLTTRSTGRASRCGLGLPSLRSAPVSADVRRTERLQFVGGMDMITRYAGIAALSMSVLSLTLSAPAQSSANSLVSTWRLVEVTDVRNGKVVHPFGEKPLGIFIYAASGYVSIQFGLRGPNTAVATACASASNAIALAQMHADAATSRCRIARSAGCARRCGCRYSQG